MNSSRRRVGGGARDSSAVCGTRGAAGGPGRAAVAGKHLPCCRAGPAGLAPRWHLCQRQWAAYPAVPAPSPSPLPAQLGADEVVDYTSEAFDQRFKDQPFDAVLDTVVLNGYEQRRWR